MIWKELHNIVIHLLFYQLANQVVTFYKPKTYLSTTSINHNNWDTI